MFIERESDGQESDLVIWMRLKAIHELGHLGSKIIGASGDLFVDGGEFLSGLGRVIPICVGG